jgi:tetratricopeptide (TPR) repeat protein
VGTVRWEKCGGASRVQVSPELSLVSTGTARWLQPFDAAITDVFQVQADIAEVVMTVVDTPVPAGSRGLWISAPAEGAMRLIDQHGLHPETATRFERIALQGDLPGAQAIAAAAKVEPTALVAFLANYWDLYWVLTPPQQDLLLRLTPRAFDDNRSAWGIALAEVSALRGDQARARAYADSAREAFEAVVRATPGDAQSHGLLGVALAYLGRKAEAIREGRRAVELAPASRDAYGGPYNQLQLVRIYILTGEPEQALDQLEALLKLPFYVSPGWLKVDPTFDPLRKNPRFQKLMETG